MAEAPRAFRRMSLAGARFEDVRLRGARFVDVDLSGASFSDATLAGARLDDVDLRNVAVTDARLDGMTIDGLLVTDLLRAHGGEAATAAPPWQRTLSIPALLRHARDTYGIAMRRALDEAGFDDIPRNGLYVIGGLALGDGDAPLAALVRDLRISKQAAGQLVDVLVARGYLQRGEDPQDRRRQIVTLTARGHAAAAVQANARDTIDGVLAQRIGPAGLDEFRGMLATLVDVGRHGETHA